MASITEVARRKEEQVQPGEGELRLAIESSPVMVWISDAEKNCTWFNKVWLDFIGRPTDEQLGRGWVDCIHPDDLQRCRATYGKLFDEREPFSMEYRLRRHDGEYRWILDNGIPTYSRDGEFTGYAGTCVDITDRKRQETDIHTSQQRLHLALESGRMGTFDWEFATGKVEWSPELEAMHGYQPGGFGGTVEAYQAEIDPEDMPAVEASVKNALETGAKHHIIYRIHRPDGKLAWVEGTGKVIRDDDGAPVRLVGVCMDITERKNAEEALARERELLQTIIDRIPVMVTVYKPDTEVVRTNPEFERILGFHQAAGVSLMDRCYPDKAYQEEVSAFMQECSGGWKDIRMTNVDGQHVETSWANVRLSDSTQVGIGIDIGERKKTELALAKRVKEQAALYEFTDRLQRAASNREIYEAALDAIQRALDCNRASILLFDEQNVMSFVAWRGLSDGYRKAVNGHTPWTPELKDAEPICVSDIKLSNEPEQLVETIIGEGIRGLAFVPLPGEDRLLGKFMVYYGEPHEFSDEEVELAMAIGRQLSFAVERRRAEAERERAQESLRQLTAELEEKVHLRTADLEGFAYSIAHDMRQHIRGVSVNASLALHEAWEIVPPEVRDNLQRLVKAAHHMSKLTDDILTHTRIGVRDLSKEEVDLSAMVEKIGQETITRAHCNPATKIVVQPGVKAVADQSMIGLVIENLLDNACKFSATNAQPVVSFGRDKESFYISDNGIGFEPKYAEKIFHAFERLEPSYEGTGIGLANVRRIIERHGGIAWAESEPGKGTKIRFSLG